MKIGTFANNQVFSGEHYLERYLHIVNEKVEIIIIKGYLYYLSSYSMINNSLVITVAQPLYFTPTKQ